MQKGAAHTNLMLDQNGIWALHDVFDEMLERDYRTRDQTNALSAFAPPIDVEPTNQHENKRAFLLEKRAVDDALNNAEALFRTFLPGSEASEETQAMLDSLGPYIDAHARKNADVPDDPGTFHMVRACAGMAGLNTSFLWLLIDMVLALRTRSNELKDQGKEFWTVTNRPPNYHARIIALRTARVYAREKGERPKFGTLRDGGAPSTSFARALERVFEILEIKAGIRGPAEWAIAQLNDADLEPMPRNALANLMSIGEMVRPSDGRTQVGNAMAKLAAKRPES